MTAITYTAKRNLASGHGAGTSYNLETDAEKIDPVRKVVGSSGVALDGTSEGVIDRIERGWSVQTDIIEEADRPLWEEFIDSVAALESFIFDAYGTTAAADNPQTVLLEQGSDSWSRVGSTMLYRLSFKVRVL